MKSKNPCAGYSLAHGFFVAPESGFEPASAQILLYKQTDYVTKLSYKHYAKFVRYMRL